MINVDAEDQGLITNTRGARSKLRLRHCCLLSLLFVFIVAFISGYVLRMFLSEKKSSLNSLGKESSEKFHEIVIHEMASSEIKENLKGFTSTQHVAGSQDDIKQTRQFIHRKWAESLGKENVELKKYNVLLSYPIKPGKVSIIDEKSGKTLFTSKGNETRLWSDEFVKNVVFPFNAYSAARSVKGKLVYVNYARARDFELLNTLNITCKGKILIARYGRNFRGNKAALAESAGAIGLILYTDPAGYASGKTTYPQSWWMPPDGVQRGTVMLGSGDPLTPGYPSNEYTFRIHENQTSLPNIPVQPISYQDALSLIKLLDGKEIPKNWKGWKGGLNATYRLTMNENSARYVHLNVSTKRERRDIYNVIGTVKGNVEPDRIVAIGSHHDAWVMGAVDPSSGASVLMEIVRAVGVAVKKGWKPRRTLMFCNWGAEEYGLIGSTEWLEDYKFLLENNVVAYLNSDSSINGNYSIDVKGSAQLANAVFDAAKQVKDPDDNSQSVYEDWRKSFPDKEQPFYPRIRAPGAGSDHRNFYVRYGVPVMDIRYTYNRDDYNHAMSYPVYHSVHDSYHWITSFVDPHFTHHLALGRIWAKVAMTLVDQQILPFNLSRLAWKLSQCQKSLLSKHGQGFAKHGININYLVESIKSFHNVSSLFNKFLASMDRRNELHVRMVNDQLMQVERSFISREGLPGSPFTKNVIFAPAEHDEYSGSCFPGVANALYFVVQKGISDWSSVSEQLSSYTCGTCEYSKDNLRLKAKNI